MEGPLEGMPKMTEMVAMAAPSRDRTKTTTPHAWKGHTLHGG